MDGLVHFSIAKSREVIYDNWDTFANLIWFCEDELSTPIDALNEPEKLETIAYIEGTNQLLGACLALLDLPDEEMEFTSDILDKLIKENEIEKLSNQVEYEDDETEFDSQMIDTLSHMRECNNFNALLNGRSYGLKDLESDLEDLKSDFEYSQK